MAGRVPLSEDLGKAAVAAGLGKGVLGVCHISDNEVVCQVCEDVIGRY